MTIDKKAGPDVPSPKNQIQELGSIVSGNGICQWPDGFHDLYNFSPNQKRTIINWTKNGPMYSVIFGKLSDILAQGSIDDDDRESILRLLVNEYHRTMITARSHLIYLAHQKIKDGEILGCEGAQELLSSMKDEENAKIRLLLEKSPADYSTAKAVEKGAGEVGNILKHPAPEGLG